MNISPGFEIIEDPKAPKGRRIVRIGASEPAPKNADETGDNAPLGYDSGDQFSDDQLRAVIEQQTGKKPHHKLGRDKLVEQFDSLNRAQA